MLKRLVGLFILLLAGVGPFFFILQLNLAVPPAEAVGNSILLKPPATGETLVIRGPDGDPADFPFCVDFNSMSLPGFAYTQTVDAPPSFGRVEFFPYPAPPEYQLHLYTECTGACRSDLTTRQAIIFQVDLENEDFLSLAFEVWEWVRDRPGNGVFISDDGGQTWAEIYNMNSLPFAGTPKKIKMDLDPLVAAAGMTYTADFLIKFETQGYLPNHNFRFDDICLQPVGARIELAHTVGTSAGECGTEEIIDVLPDTEVVHCYQVTNTGEYELLNHDLVDSELGVILDGLVNPLGLGESFSILHTSPASGDAVHSATWTAYDPGQPDVIATASDQAEVNVVFPAEFPACVNFNDGFADFMYKDFLHNPPNYGRVYLRGSGYPGPDSGTTAMITDSEISGDTTRQGGVIALDLTGQENVWLDFRVAKAGNTFTPEDGVFISDDRGETWARIYDLGDTPSEYERVRLNLVQAANQVGVGLVDDFLIKFQSRSANTFPNDGYGFDDICIRPAQASILMDMTVSTDPAVCGTANSLHVAKGTEATFCYTVENTGEVTLTQHTLHDFVYGTLLDEWPETLPMGEQTMFTKTAVITESRVHSANWTASLPGTTYETSSSDALVVEALEPAELPFCESFSSTEMPSYMYAFTENEPPAVGRVQITDRYPIPVDGNYAVDLDSESHIYNSYSNQSANLILNLQEDESVWLDFWVQGHYIGSDWRSGVQISDDGGMTWTSIHPLTSLPNIYEHRVINLAEAAMNNGVDLNDGFQVRLQARTYRPLPEEGMNIDTICLRPEHSEIDISVTVGNDPAVCADSNYFHILENPALVTYCYQVTNTGAVTFTSHNITDSYVGQVWDNELFLLPPGETTWFTRNVTVTNWAENEVWWEAMGREDWHKVYGRAEASVYLLPTDVSLSIFEVVTNRSLLPFIGVVLISMLLSFLMWRMKRQKT